MSDYGRHALEKLTLDELRRIYRKEADIRSVGTRQKTWLIERILCIRCAHDMRKLDDERGKWRSRYYELLGKTRRNAEFMAQMRAELDEQRDGRRRAERELRHAKELVTALLARLDGETDEEAA